MEKGFLIGVAIGVAATMAYEAGNKAKKEINKGKQLVKDKINGILD
ncbi:MAG: hypothetical protein RR357_00565 [Clostridia bacterium]